MFFIGFVEIIADFEVVHVAAKGRCQNLGVCFVLQDIEQGCGFFRFAVVQVVGHVEHRQPADFGIGMFECLELECIAFILCHLFDGFVKFFLVHAGKWVCISGFGVISFGICSGFGFGIAGSIIGFFAACAEDEE